MNSELVSIVMATYNGEKYLRQQMDSILAQTYGHFELIVVDDASTDRTIPILQEYAASDDRVQVFPAEKNIGFVANFERGLRLVKGEFIAFSDQDDVFREDKIELLQNALIANQNCDLVISDLTVIDESGKEIVRSMWRYQRLKPKPGKPFRRLIYNNFATGCAMMIRRRLLDFALPFPPDCHAHDWWLAVVAASFNGGGICLVNDPLTAYRQHGKNVMGAKAATGLEIKTIIDRINMLARSVSAAEKMVNYWKPNIANLSGYLRMNFWTSNERSVIENTKETLEGYWSDQNSSLMSRLIKLPQRLRSAATTGSFSHCINVVFVTIWPKL